MHTRIARRHAHRKIASYRTGQSATIPYLHRVQDTPDMGSTYGQDVEPAGKYVIELDESLWPDPAQAEQMIGADRSLEALEYGHLQTSSPLVVRHDGGSGWKYDLSEEYGGLTGRALTRALVADGWDALVTVGPWGTEEIISLDARETVSKIYRAR